MALKQLECYLSLQSAKTSRMAHAAGGYDNAAAKIREQANHELPMDPVCRG